MKLEFEVFDRIELSKERYMKIQEEIQSFGFTLEYEIAFANGRD